MVAFICLFLGGEWIAWIDGMNKKWMYLKSVEGIKGFLSSPYYDELLLRLRADSNLDIELLVEELFNDNPEVLQLTRLQYELLGSKLKFQALDIQFACYGEENYPHHFYQMPDPPLALSYLGRPLWMNHRLLSVVGSREPGQISLRWMENHLSSFLQKQKVCIVSGGARGIDQYAHMLSIREGAPTIAILPSGLNQIYPTQFLSMKEKILDSGGAIVSEYLPDQKMMKHLFHHRNRLISGISPMVLIVEAWNKSGTLMTGHHSLIHGRQVGVVPGHPEQICFQGSLSLLSLGAVMVRNSEDLTQHLTESVQYLADNHQR